MQENHIKPDRELVSISIFNSGAADEGKEYPNPPRKGSNITASKFHTASIFTFHFLEKM